MPAVRPAAILLDTHAFLWSIHEPLKLSKTARRALENPHTRIYLSVASVWEISLKAGKGKLDAPDGVIDAQIASLGITPLPIGLPHIRALTALNAIEDHKDPFDRLIAAQAITEQLPLVTTDTAFRKYRNVVVIW